VWNDKVKGNNESSPSAPNSGVFSGNLIFNRDVIRILVIQKR